jgi:uncharacterized BrkB/YihY/UPF0761 family membrane protein
MPFAFDGAAIPLSVTFAMARMAPTRQTGRNAEIEKMKTSWSAVVSAVSGFIDDDCMVNGTALAFYTIFSLPPLLVMVFYVAGWFGFSQSQIDSVVRRQIGLPTSELTQDA